MRRVVLYLSMVLAIPVTVACVTAAELDQRLAIWLDQDADLLASAWGAPQGTYIKKDGSRILSYERTNFVMTGGSMDTSMTSRYCRVDFHTDQEGKIVSARWHGAPDQCGRVIPDRSSVSKER